MARIVGFQFISSHKIVKNKNHLILDGFYFLLTYLKKNGKIKKERGENRYAFLFKWTID
jgi:hypothetical protein